MEKYTESEDVQFDERTSSLKVIKKFDKKNIHSEIVNIYTGEKRIKEFLDSNSKMKINAEKQVMDIKTTIEKLKEQESNLKKNLVKLTPEQEKLIEDLRVVGTYEGVDKVRQQIKQHEAHLNQIEEGLKKDNMFFEKIKKTSKIK